MGITVEFNPDLALRHWSEYTARRREEAECIPESLEAGKVYPFLKKGQRNYWLHGEIPLIETKGNQELSRPLASIIIQEAAHSLQDGEAYTHGTYKVIEVFTDTTPRFNGFARV